ncbi:RES domain-containing protein [Bradyrhizobium sp. 1(2017)]|uniref:RES domain-containing protein n=1 Tax=Bradyrhizobium sp. 1(2017) TaxID=1404888 RepID=UPI00140F0BD1|nr:RES domain-containing protein [Bradyrhizobium sp. 1(2017)]QIO32283.1 RES domain-containing protein [Bradyrhizobium sp. 1(2017)]
MNRSMGWRILENWLRTEARCFSRTAADYLTSIFDGVAGLKTRAGRPLVVDAGPGKDFHTLYRARVFQSDGKLETALGRPDNHLASPPSLLAMAGHINARGVSVFYGANNQNAAIAEVRPLLVAGSRWLSSKLSGRSDCSTWPRSGTSGSQKTLPISGWPRDWIAPCSCAR